MKNIINEAMNWHKCPIKHDKIFYAHAADIVVEALSIQKKEVLGVVQKWWDDTEVIYLEQLKKQIEGGQNG